MHDILVNSSFFCVTLTLVAFCIASACQQKWKFPLLNPIIVASALVMLFLWLLDIPVEQYQENCQWLSYLMTPATICLVLSCYQQIKSLKKHLGAILFGVVGGTLCSLLSVWGMCKLFGFDEVLTISLLPKSVTTAIGAVMSQQCGGIGALTTVVIILTGIFGNVAGPWLTKLFRLTDPIAQGTAYGTASHIVGTSRATEISPLVGAVSSLSLTFAGLITAVLLSLVL
jgi:putative effector of murein hydrolase